MDKQGNEYDKQDLIREIIARRGGDHDEIEGILDVTFEVIADAVGEFGRVDLHRIGVFNRHHVLPYEHYNVISGEVETIPEHDRARFHGSPNWKKRIKSHTGFPVH